MNHLGNHHNKYKLSFKEKLFCSILSVIILSQGSDSLEIIEKPTSLMKYKIEEPSLLSIKTKSIFDRVISEKWSPEQFKKLYNEEESPFQDNTLKKSKSKSPERSPQHSPKQRLNLEEDSQSENISNLPSLAGSTETEDYNSNDSVFGSQSTLNRSIPLAYKEFFRRSISMDPKDLLNKST